jgi:AcrR family transcriptional regulator
VGRVSDTRSKLHADPLLGRILGGGVAAAEDASERILRAAVQQIEDFGVRRFTIDDLARRVGLSRVTIYRYFPRKEALIEEVLLSELRRFLADVDAVVAGYDSLEDRSVEGFVFALTFLREHRVLDRLLRTEPELILPLLTTHAAPVLEAGRKYIEYVARREAQESVLPLSDRDIATLSELLARSVLSFVLTPESVMGLRDEAGIRRFAERYIRPVIRAFTR